MYIYLANRTNTFQENNTYTKELGIPLEKCLPKIHCSVETIRKCQLVYYAYDYKKVDQQGFKVSVLPPLSFLCLLRKYYVLE